MSPEKKQPRPFSAWLLEQRGGLTHAELSDALAEVAEGVLEHGKVGELRIAFKLKRVGDGVVSITDTVTAKVPEGDRESSLFYADESGALIRENPRQTKIDHLREVPGREVREAGS